MKGNRQQRLLDSGDLGEQFFRGPDEDFSAALFDCSFALPLLQKPACGEGAHVGKRRELHVLDINLHARGNHMSCLGSKTRQRECEPFLSGFGDQRDVPFCKQSDIAQDGSKGGAGTGLSHCRRIVRDAPAELPLTHACGSVDRIAKAG